MNLSPHSWLLLGGGLWLRCVVGNPVPPPRWPAFPEARGVQQRGVSYARHGGGSQGAGRWRQGRAQGLCPVGSRAASFPEAPRSLKTEREADGRGLHAAGPRLCGHPAGTGWPRLHVWALAAVTAGWPGPGPGKHSSIRIMSFCSQMLCEVNAVTAPFYG